MLTLASTFYLFILSWSVVVILSLPRPPHWAESQSKVEQPKVLPSQELAVFPSRPANSRIKWPLYCTFDALGFVGFTGASRVGFEDIVLPSFSHFRIMNFTYHTFPRQLLHMILRLGAKICLIQLFSSFSFSLFLSFPTASANKTDRFWSCSQSIIWPHVRKLIHGRKLNKKPTFMSKINFC